MRMSACKLYVYDELMPVLRQALAMYMYAAFFMAAVVVVVALGLAASRARRAMRKPHDDWDDSEDHMRGAAYASRSKRSRDGRSSRRGSHRLALHRVEAARRESASSPCSTYCGVFTLMAFVIFATYVLAVKRVASRCHRLTGSACAGPSSCWASSPATCRSKNRRRRRR